MMDIVPLTAGKGAKESTAVVAEGEAEEGEERHHAILLEDLEAVGALEVAADWVDMEEFLEPDLFVYRRCCISPHDNI